MSSEEAPPQVGDMPSQAKPFGGDVEDAHLADLAHASNVEAAKHVVQEDLEHHFVAGGVQTGGDVVVHILGSRRCSWTFYRTCYRRQHVLRCPVRRRDGPAASQERPAVRPARRHQHPRQVLRVPLPRALECRFPERLSRMPVARQRQLQGPAANTSLPTPFLTPAVPATCIESELQHELRGMAEARHVGGGALGAAGGSFVLGQAAGEFDFASEEMDAS